MRCSRQPEGWRSRGVRSSAAGPPGIPSSRAGASTAASLRGPTARSLRSMPPAPRHPLLRVERKLGHRYHSAGPDPVARAEAQTRRCHGGRVESPLRASREMRPAVRTSPSGVQRLSRAALRRLRPTFRVEPRLTVRVTDLPVPACRHVSTCSPRRVGRRGNEQPQPEHPGTSLDTSNLPTSRGALSLYVGPCARVGWVE